GSDDLALFDLGEELAHFAGPEAAVAAERADGRDLAGTGPAGHRLGVDAEHRRHLGGGEQGVVLVRLVVGPVRHGVSPRWVARGWPGAPQGELLRLPPPFATDSSPSRDVGRG